MKHDDRVTQLFKISVISQLECGAEEDTEAQTRIINSGTWIRFSPDKKLHSGVKITRKNLQPVTPKSRFSPGIKLHSGVKITRKITCSL
jgi:hypothetical protein